MSGTHRLDLILAVSARRGPDGGWVFEERTFPNPRAMDKDYGNAWSYVPVGIGKAELASIRESLQATAIRVAEFEERLKRPPRPHGKRPLRSRAHSQLRGELICP
jgi:hypothetical protein